MVFFVFVNFVWWVVGGWTAGLVPVFGVQARKYGEWEGGEAVRLVVWWCEVMRVCVCRVCVVEEYCVAEKRYGKYCTLAIQRYTVHTSCENW